MKNRTSAKRSPSAVTLGETSHQAAKVDWLTITWKPEPDEHVPAAVLDLLRQVGIPVEAEGGVGHFGYAEGARLFTRLDDGARHHIGLLDWGGARLKGRARLDLSGSACSRISDWQTVHDWIACQWEPSITRVDLAVDCLEGQFTVNDAHAWLLSGEFTSGEGRPPRHSTPGDWLSEVPYYGRTLEIGRRENGKMLRAYEKGLQLNPGSGDKWTRFEVEFRNKDRDIPLDVLLRSDVYFAGAYECLSRLLPAAGERIATHQKEGEITIQRLTHYAREAYGKLFSVFRGRLDIAEVMDVLSRPGIPRRLEKSSLAGFHLSDSPSAFLSDRP